MSDTTGGFQRHRFMRIANVDVIALTGAEPGFDHVTKVSMVDDNIGKACPSEIFQMILDQCFAARAKHGFGHGIGQGAHALPAPGSQNHRSEWNALRNYSQLSRPAC